MEIHALGERVIFPLARFGLQTPFFGLNIDTLISTWVSMLVFIVLAYLVRRQIISNKNSLVAFSAVSFVQWFEEFVNDSLGFVKEDLIIFSISIFLYILGSSVSACILLKEATLDLNTDLAIAIVVFSYIQIWGMRFKGWRYFEKFVEPVFLFAPLNIVTQGSKVLAICFRIFANVLSGALIWEIFQNLFNKLNLVFLISAVASLLIAGLSYLKWPRVDFSKSTLATVLKAQALLPGAVFGIFIIIHGGFMQAGILMILLVNYLSIEVQGHD